MDIKIIPPRQAFFSLPEIFFRIYSYCGKFSKSDFDSKTILNPPQLLKTFSFLKRGFRQTHNLRKDRCLVAINAYMRMELCLFQPVFPIRFSNVGNYASGKIQRIHIL